MLKLYTQDHGWAGVLIVTAASEEEARKIMMENCQNYNYKTKEIEEHSLENFVYENTGDT